MAAFLLYIIKSSCCLVLFYLGYKALLSNESCFRFNRKVLIGGMIVCMLLPLVKLKTNTPAFIQQPFIKLERMINIEEAIIPVTDVVIADNSANTATEKPFSPLIIFVIYLTGAGAIMGWLIRSFFSLFLLIRGGTRIRSGNYVIVVLNRPAPPFNWWKYIILSESDYQTHPNEIIAHESAHYRRRHSLDLAFAECIILLHWFNPAAWLLKRELRDIHEYEADTEVLKSGIDATRYQLLLVKKAVGSSSYTLANSFNQSKLKKRITMMCNNQSNKLVRWKLVLLVPVAACTLYAFARPDVNRQFEQLIPSESTTIPQDNKSSDLGSEAKVSIISIKFYRGDKELITANSYNATGGEFKFTAENFRIKKEDLEQITGISISVPKDTPTETITEIKKAIRQLFADKLDIKMEYRSHK